MSNQSFANELARALARPDVDNLRRVLSDYHEYHETFQKDPDEASRRCVIDPIIHEVSDPDRNLALIALALDDYDDPFFLGLMAAGPLEDILMFDPAPAGEEITASPSDEIFERVMKEARVTPRFRWMLGGIYTNHLTAKQQAEFDLTIDRTKHEPEFLPPRGTI